MLYKKRILVAPLNWGLGHATRCIPIIKELIKQQAEVIIGGDNLPLELLRKEFPELEYIEFPGMEIKYKSNSSLILNMALQANKFFKAFVEEQRFLQKAVENYAIDAVISDNRYGAFSNEVPSFLITHQVFLNLPMGKKVMDKVIKNYISNFDECWIPDFPGNKNLSGDLSHKKDLPENYYFIGPLSRFSNFAKSNSKKQRKLMIILSGPEPDRTNLESKLLEQLSEVEYEVLLVRGVQAKLHLGKKNPYLQVETVLTTEDLHREIISSEIILSRSGYSTIMDLAALGKNAILVPTKGQTEQEYLAEKFKSGNLFFSTEEKNLNLEEALRESCKYEGLKIDYNNSILIEKLTNLFHYSKK